MQFFFTDHVLDRIAANCAAARARSRVEPQVFDVLYYLLENRDRVVSKDELIDSVWGGRIVSEFDPDEPHQRGPQAPSATAGETRRLIRTIARKGFRFVGDVRISEPARCAEPANDRADQPIPPHARRFRRPIVPPSPCFPSPT